MKITSTLSQFKLLIFMENRTKITSRRNTLILIADTTQCFSKQAFRSCFVETYTPTYNVSYCFIKKYTIPYTQFMQFIYPFVLRCNISVLIICLNKPCQSYFSHKYLVTRQSIISSQPFISRQPQCRMYNDRNI